MRIMLFFSVLDVQILTLKMSGDTYGDYDLMMLRSHNILKVKTLILFTLMPALFAYALIFFNIIPCNFASIVVKW